MHPDAASLSSVSTALEDLTRRVGEAAERLSGGEREGAAAELFEVERALVGATRRLAKAIRELG